jgi:hypothetical protein
MKELHCSLMPNMTVEHGNPNPLLPALRATFLGEEGF